MNRRAVVPFVVVAALLLAALGADTWVRRPRAIPAPVTADSLAGVLARLFPGRVDSADVGRVTWRESPDSWLGINWVRGDTYAYRGKQAAYVPLDARADLKQFRITFAKGHARDPLLVKHELGHLLLREPDHPAAIFQRIEGYRAR